MQILSNRLQSAAIYCRPSAHIADIGTDHAYLPINLIQTNRASHAIAADISAGPLDKARSNIEKAGLSDYIELRQGNGLSVINAQEADDIFICGMGGIVMSEIIEGASWLKSGGKRLVLQPMTKAYELRRYLYLSGYSILHENAVIDSSKAYTVICAEYTGTVCDDELLFFTGGLNPDNDPYSQIYLEKVYADVSNRLIGAGLMFDYDKKAKLTYVRDSILRMMDK